MRIVGHRMRLTQAHVERMLVPRRFWGVRFDKVPNDVREDVDQYLRRLDEHLDHGDGLLFWGSNGVGKTSVAVLIAFEIRRRGASVLFVTAEGLRQAVLEREQFDNDQSVIDRAREVDCLVLDDLGKEHSGETGFTEHLFENLIRQRSASRRVTIITTNLPMTDTVVNDGDGNSLPGFLNIYIPSMVEVMKEAFFPIEFKGENLRKVSRDALSSRMAC